MDRPFDSSLAKKFSHINDHYHVQFIGPRYDVQLHGPKSKAKILHDSNIKMVSQYGVKYR